MVIVASEATSNDKLAINGVSVKTCFPYPYPNPRVGPGDAYISSGGNEDWKGQVKKSEL